MGTGNRMVVAQVSSRQKSEYFFMYCVCFIQARSQDATRMHSNMKVCKILPFRHKCSTWGFLKGFCQDFSLNNLKRLTYHGVREKTFLQIKCLKQRIEINKVYWRSPICKWSEKGWIVIWKVAEAIEYWRYKPKSWSWGLLELLNDLTRICREDKALMNQKLWMWGKKTRVIYW